jgi:hypothetical protein
MFNTKCFPGTVSFNTGAPFIPFARNPQVSFTQNFGDFNATFTALSQLDFVSTGPGGASSSYLRNSTIPNLNLKLEYLTKNAENGTEFLIGVSGNYKTIQPRTVTEEGYKTDTRFSSTSISYFLKYRNRMITIKLHGFSGGDATDIVMLGGYAVKEITDAVKGFEKYTPIRNNAFWTDIHTNGKKWQFGVFGGYTKNLGAADEIKGDIYSRGANIDYVYRGSGRVIFNSGKFRVAPEIEYTVAAYAQVDENDNLLMDEKGKITQSKEIGNFRFLIGVYYFF